MANPGAEDESESLRPTTTQPTGDMEGGALDGALPPEDADYAPSGDEAYSEEPQARRRISERLSDWGPWRRFATYRELWNQDFTRKRDPEANEKSRLPATENVQVPVIWIAELYSPSSIKGLLRGISELGWEHSRNHRDHNLLKWMADVRRGRLAGWTNLGLVTPPRERQFSSDRTAYLPPGVRVVMPQLMSLTPSITALVAAFVFDDQTADSLDALLLADYPTRTEPSRLFRRSRLPFYILFGTPLRLSRSIYTPELQRREAASARLAELERRCVRWVRQKVPGIFASGIRSGAYPSAVLLVSKETAPMSHEARKVTAFEGLAIDRDYDAWESDEWPKARLVFPRSWKKEGMRLTFACRRRDAFPKQPGYSDAESNFTIAYRAHNLIPRLLSRWGLSGMLDGYHEELSELRDRLASPRAHRPIRDLKRLRSFSRMQLLDIVTSSHEIQEFAGTDWRYQYEVMDMKRSSSAGDHEGLVGDLSREQNLRAEQVRRSAEVLQSTMSATVGASQAISGIRIQRLAIFLAFISIGIAIVALALSTSG